MYKIFNKDNYNAESNRLSTLDTERERLNKEKNRIIQICNAREEAKKAKEQLPKIESQIDSLKSELEDRKKKLIEAIDEQISANLYSETKTESDKQKIIYRLEKEIYGLREKISQIENLLEMSDSKLQEQTQSQLDKKRLEKERNEKKFENDLKYLKEQKTLYKNLKIHIDDSEIIKKLLEKVLDKTEANKDGEITICNKEYSVDTNTGLIEMQDRNNGDINVEEYKENDGEITRQDIRLDKESKSWYNEYVNKKMKEEKSGTIVTDKDLLKFNVSGRYNNENDDEREAI